VDVTLAPLPKCVKRSNQLTVVILLTIIVFNGGNAFAKAVRNSQNMENIRGQRTHVETFRRTSGHVARNLYRIETCKTEYETDFMELIPSSEAASYAATQELPSILWNRALRWSLS
jgi:type II secretory pathway pseudopilin PulG